MNALNARGQRSRNDATARGADAKVNEFSTVLASSEAVICQYFGEFFRLAWSDEEIYATFYQRVDAGIRFPDGNEWNRLRANADTVIFGDLNKKMIRFAALSLDGIGVENYGDCSMTLKPTMIEHRATAFHENTVVFMERQKNKYAVPAGYRSSWDGRGDLCVAKLGDQLMTDTDPAMFPSILLTHGATSADDHFVEVHIWGSVTMRSFRRVIIRKWAIEASPAQILAVSDRLAQLGVDFAHP